MFKPRPRHRFHSLPMLALVALFALTSCGDSPSTPELPGAFEARDKLRPVPPMPHPGDTEMQHSRYFPLQESNRWLYVVDDGQRMAEVRIPGTARIGGQQVFAVENYLFPLSPGRTLFRNDVSGRTVEYIDRAPQPWYPRGDFGHGHPVRLILPEGDDCIHGATGESSGALEHATVPAGTFLQCVAIEYRTGPCEDSGLVREVFAVEAGLIQRTVMTTHGPETWSLTYAEVDGETFGDLPDSPE